MKAIIKIKKNKALFLIIGILLGLSSCTTTSYVSRKIEIIQSRFRPWTNTSSGELHYASACRYTGYLTLRSESKNFPQLNSLLLISVVFPEVRCDGSEWSSMTDIQDYYLAYPVGMRGKVEKFVNDFYNKGIVPDREKSFFDIFNKLTAGFLFNDDRFRDVDREVAAAEVIKNDREQVKRLRDIQLELNQFISDTLAANIKPDASDAKLIPLIYLVKGYIQGWFREYKEAIQTYNKILELKLEGIDDYKLTAEFNKARCLGALSKEIYVRQKYDLSWTQNPAFWTWAWSASKGEQPMEDVIYCLHDLTEGKEANEIYRDILKNYGHMSKTRRAIFIWSQEILAGKRLPELYSSPPQEY